MFAAISMSSLTMNGTAALTSKSAELRRAPGRGEALPEEPA